MRRFLGVLSMATILGLAFTARADEAAAPHDLLRVRRGGKSIEGRLVAADDDSLMLTAQGRTVSIPRREIERLEVSRGRMIGKGAGLGAAVGAGLGAALGVGLIAALDGQDDWVYRSSDYVAVGAVTGTVGAITGTALGALTGACFERWKPARVSPVALSVLPRRGGASVAFAVRF
jgi:hypothetical protein